MVAEQYNREPESIDSTERDETRSFFAKLKAKTSKLSPEETRETLTPFAFKIDQSLFGISLALPWRRGAALLIDLFFVAILSDAPGELLALLVAVTLFRLGSKKRAEKFGKKRGLRKRALRIIAALVVFIVLIDTLPDIFSKMDRFNNNVEQAGQSQQSKAYADKIEQSDDNSVTFIKGTLIVASALTISQSDCTAYDCWHELTSKLFNAFAEQEPTTEEAEQFIDNLQEQIEDKGILNTAENKKLVTALQQQWLAHKDNPIKAKNELIVGAPDLIEVLAEEDTGNLKALNALTSVSSNDEGNASVYKGFAWLQGLIEDLGIGFGWAAFYFTMFTAIWHGQTPGKKLLRIRVIQLDGTPLSVWDSFGRYGGYGAGIATGLLGFAQIYWDPNRQAIHDKISATVVINDTEQARQQIPNQKRQSITSEVKG
jgi:hypothetical protein